MQDTETGPVPDEATLTVGDLAQRTGVAAGTLRMWEQRHGFPEPVRLPSGHRRYRESDVDAVRRVAQDRDRGVRLDRAVAALQRPDALGGSVYGLLRRRHPEMSSHQMHKRTIAALSRALEDEFCATADRRRILGGFQHTDHFRGSAQRWGELATIGTGATVFAVPGDEPPVDRPPLHHVPLQASSHVRREWFVVCESSTLPVALAAWELPGQQGVRDAERLFDVTWSLEPAVVTDAVRVCRGLSLEAGLDFAEPEKDLGEAVVTAPAALFLRAIAYVDDERRVRLG